MADKKRKKLRAGTVGAGDPTFVINFEVEANDDSQYTNVGLSINIGDKAHTVYSNNLTAAYPFGQDITVMGSFSADDNNPPCQIPATVKYTIFDPKDYSVVDSEIEIAYPSISQIATPNQTLGASQFVGFQSEQGEGNYTFMVNAGVRPEYGDSIYTSPFFISTSPNNVWIVKQNEAYPTVFSIQNQYTNKYLSIQTEGLVMVDQPCDATNWVFQKISDKATLYSFQNQSTQQYLKVDQQTGVISLAQDACSWFLHFKQEK